MPKIILLADFSEEYFKKILLGIARFSKENGPWIFCRMPLYYREKEKIEGIIRWAREWGANGMIAQLENKDDSDLLTKAGFPIIVTDLRERFRNVPNITGDYVKTGCMGADYFLEKGYTNFAYYGYPSFVWARERGEGFAARLREKGYSTFFFENKADPDHEMWYYKPSALSKWLKSLPKPIAIMACDDNCGQQVTESCKLCGINIPEEVAVLGVDNDELVCNLSDPPLSSIHLDAEQGGYDAAKMLQSVMNGHKEKPENIVVQPVKVVTRESTDIYATSDREIAKALKFIHQNIDKSISVNDVLALVPMSRRVFEIRFKKVVGQPVYRYFLNLKMKELCAQLRESEKTIMEIALSLGFGDMKNVSRQFKQVVGCSPSEYRKNNSF